MKNGLFRPEAVQAARQQWLGPMRLVQPPALRWLTLGAAALLGALLLLLLAGHYTRKASLPGVLSPVGGVVRLQPSSAAVVRAVHVHDGQAVGAGDLLFELALDRPARNDATQARLDAAVAAQRQALANAADQQRRWVAQRERTLGLRLEALQAEQAALAAEVATHGQRLALARQALERDRALRRQGFVAETQLQASEAALLALEGQGQGLRRQQATLARERAELEGERAALPAERDAALAQMQSQQAEADRDGADLHGVRRIEVRAPQAGTVQGVAVRPGQSVAPPIALASLLPADGRLQAELWAPSAALGPLQPGLPVRLRLDAWPHERHGHLTGRVAAVSRVPLTPGDWSALPLVAPPTGGDLRYRVTVALDPLPPDWAGRDLPPGMRLQADVLLERRTLLDWILAPLRAAKDRL